MFLDNLLDLEKAPAARSYSDKEYNLEGYAAWVEAIGAPHRGQAFIHIAGTKGKGSTVALCEAILRGNGFPTAAYTSPHLSHFGERFRFDGVPWTREAFESRGEAFLDGLMPELRRGLSGPHHYRTAFEVLTALALVEFRKHPAALSGKRRQVVCWETGLGGRLDCTNIVDPLATVITTMGMDHTALLGDTIEKIAREKAGIIKRGRPVIVSRQAPEFEERVMKVIVARAAEVGAPVVRAWEHNPVLSAKPVVGGGQELEVRLPDGAVLAVRLPLNGGFQQVNLESAVAATWYAAKELGAPLTAEGIARGVGMADWPGRLEVHPAPTGELLVLDGAHCPLSASVLAGEVNALLRGLDWGIRRKVVLLFGMQADKNHREFLTKMSIGLGHDTIEAVLCYPVGGQRGAKAEDLVSAAQKVGLNAAECTSVEDALAMGRTTGRTIVACGTLYTIAAIRDAWRKG